MTSTNTADDAPPLAWRAMLVLCAAKLAIHLFTSVRHYGYSVKPPGNRMKPRGNIVMPRSDKVAATSEQRVAGPKQVEATFDLHVATLKLRSRT